jgi:membrane-bound lytic murein transglycosylase C
MTCLRISMALVLLLLSGCQTTDKTLSTADRLLRSTTGRTVIDLAQGKDPKQILKERAETYQRNPEAAIRDLRAVPAGL